MEGEEFLRDCFDLQLEKLGGSFLPEGSVCVDMGCGTGTLFIHVFYFYFVLFSCCFLILFIYLFLANSFHFDTHFCTELLIMNLYK